MTLWEVLVRLNYNPEDDPRVTKMKKAFASIIDTLDDIRNEVWHTQQGRMCSIAITEVQKTKMVCVDALFPYKQPDGKKENS